MEFHLCEQYIPLGQVKADPSEFGALTSSGAIFLPAKSRVSQTCVAQFHVRHDCAHSIGRFNRGAQRWSALFFRGFPIASGRRRHQPCIFQLKTGVSAPVLRVC